MSAIWTLLEGPLISLTLAVVLMLAAIALLWEYRRLFLANPRALMSAEVLLEVITGCGAPGYLAAFFLAGAVLSIAAGVYSLIFNVSSYVAS